MARRVILHIDLDYFYAQCEENARPAIQGKPVVVCVYSGRTSDSGVVSTSNYEARKYGVKAGMVIANAKKLLQSTSATFLPTNFPLYGAVSGRIMNILRTQGDIFEKAGIDEAYLDASEHTNGDYQAATIMARNIKQDIFTQEHITSSIGIASNKLLAKIASDHSKPDGLTIVKPEEAEGFFKRQPVNKIPGIGLKVEGKLRTFNVQTIDDLAGLNPILLQESFGRKLGTFLYLAARGNDEEPVQDRELPTQLSRIGTLKQNTRDFSLIQPLLKLLTQSLIERLQTEEMTCRTVSIISILTDLTTHTKSRTLESPTMEFQVVDECAQQLMKEALEAKPEAMLRRVGVKVSELAKTSGQTNIQSFFSTSNQE